MNRHIIFIVDSEDSKQTRLHKQLSLALDTHLALLRSKKFDTITLEFSNKIYVFQLVEILNKINGKIEVEI